MDQIATCAKCGSKNRLKSSSPGATPNCGRCGEPLPWLVDATDQTFAEEVEVPVPVLVDLWAPWCGPCRTLAPLLAELATDLAGRLKIVKVNVDMNPALAARFNARSIPMLQVLKAGEVVDTVVGARPKAALRAVVEPHL